MQNSYYKDKTMEQTSSTENSVQNSNATQQPQVFVTNSNTTKSNLLWTVLGVVLAVAVYSLLIALAYACVRRGWFFVIMFFIGGLTTIFPVFKCKKYIDKYLLYIRNQVSGTKIAKITRIILLGLLALLLILCLFYILNKENPDSKLIAGFLLYVISGLSTSILTYKASKEK